MISALAWIQKGVAKPKPLRYEMNESEYERIQSLVNDELEAAKQDAAEAKQKAKTIAAAAPKAQTIEELEPELAKYNLDDYDDTPEVQAGDGDDNGDDDIDGLGAGNVSSLFSRMKDLTDQVGDDEYLKPKDGDSDSEDDEYDILPTDNVLLAARTEENISQLEMCVYEEQESNMYVHHDFMLPAFPLCVEPLDFDVRNPANDAATANFVAIGTFDPFIEIWNLDLLDCMFPDVVLGQQTADGKMRAKDRSVIKGSQRKEFHTDAIMGLSWNRSHRNLLASSSADRTVKLWDLRTAQCAASYDHHLDKVQAVEWNPAETTVLATGGYDRRVTVFDSRSPGSIMGTSLTGDVECLRWDPHSPQCLYVTSDDGIVTYLDVRNLSSASVDAIQTLPQAPALYRIHAHDDAVSGFDVHPHVPGCIVTGSNDQKIKFWNIGSDLRPSMVLSRNLGVGKVFSLAFCPDSPFHLAAAGSEGKALVWNTYNNRSIRETFGPRFKGPTTPAVSANDNPVGVQHNADSDEEENKDGLDQVGAGSFAMDEDEDSD
ncbi:rRNA-processing protein [Dimargaris cristalligena]|uniref:WD40-repeat-containing domain protein n=1 Tax=Dimargaris cristalligena TaxID=215637 RepID=A0A4Q0A0K7_9FUNG|nr:rRNA-processing protein [Dimargaris cristalligena]RKP39258.1 WD40-repeat-containing domain protein [Dimargaris cristalligena]|eukprot:RKP39258.1 WD40-repeat-containing domain protein [Dimargaris cristalligena]